MSLRLATVAVLAAVAPATFAGGAGAAVLDLRHTNLPRAGLDVRGGAGGAFGLGDANGDGRPDFAVRIDGLRAGETTIRVVFGPLPPGKSRLERLPGYEVTVPAGNPSARYAAAGDVNGDGLADLIVARGAAAHVIFGSASTDPVAAEQPGPRGFAIDGIEAEGTVAPQGQALSAAVAGARDVNGDGLDDVVVGSPSASPGGRAQAGSAFVVYGSRDPSGVRLAELGERGFRIDGAEARDRVGLRAAGVGDVNGDGRPDVAVGGERPQPEFEDEPLYVVFGRGGSERVDLAALGGAGFAIRSARGGFGVPVIRAGDVNGDRLADLLVGASVGRAYLVYGRASSDPVDVGALGDRGVTFVNGEDWTLRGSWPLGLAAPGDLDGDGHPDLVLESLGEATVVFGAADLPGTVDLTHRPWSAYTIAGVSSVATAGDVNGDGRTDLLATGGAGYDCAGSESGSGTVMVVPGARTPPLEPRHARFTRLADRLVGTAGGDNLFGGRGNDRIDGRTGDDCLTGGDDDILTAAGNDYYAPRPDDDRIAGGPGDDMLDGGVGRDRLDGGAGDDRIYGGTYADVLTGGPGDDLLVEYEPEFEAPNVDVFRGGPGADRIDALDDEREIVDCGPGRDRARVDRKDVTIGCEKKGGWRTTLRAAP